MTPDKERAPYDFIPQENAYQEGLEAGHQENRELNDITLPNAYELGLARGVIHQRERAAALVVEARRSVAILDQELGPNFDPNSPFSKIAKDLHTAVTKYLEASDG